MATQGLTDQGTGKYAQAGTYKVYYNDAGKGDTVVMLHGGGPGASGWSNYSRNIGHFAAKRRVILLDCPGFGRSDTVTDYDTPRDIINAQAVKDLIDHLGIDKVTLVGNSMGGATSMRFALEWPERVRKLVLMGAAGGGVSIFQPLPLEGIKHLIGLYRNPTLEGLKRMIEIFVYDPSAVTDDLIQGRFNAMMANKAHLESFAKTASRPERLITDFSPHLHRIVAPTLVTWGRDDRFVPLDHGLKLLWHLPDAQLHVFNKCGHWAQWEHADRFNRLVDDFLSH
ncbi:MAG: alpha/beta fold hydrolase [SAR202 cluster bacterium]|nr:alpha/beta fold hydrolase [SAR202 cluster bacterium]